MCYFQVLSIPHYSNWAFVIYMFRYEWEVKVYIIGAKTKIWSFDNKKWIISFLHIQTKACIMHYKVWFHKMKNILTVKPSHFSSTHTVSFNASPTPLESSWNNLLERRKIFRAVLLSNYANKCIKMKHKYNMINIRRYR